MKSIAFADGETWPALGLGTWRLGESASRRAPEVAAVRTAIELGYRVIDTAEMYGEGGAEAVVGQAIAEALRAGDVSREQLFVVSKVYPHNASRQGVVQACERSRQRLGLDALDLYLLHWRGAHALVDTVAGFEALKAGGLVRRWGVSNFDAADLTELAAVPGGRGCATNQVFYALSERGVEFDLLPRQRREKMPLMAYCPLGQGELARHPALAQIGARVGASAAQVALAWLLQQGGVIAIPKAARAEHLRDNLAAASLALAPDDLAALDRLFPPPTNRQTLAVV